MVKIPNSLTLALVPILLAGCTKLPLVKHRLQTTPAPAIQATVVEEGSVQIDLPIEKISEKAPRFVLGVSPNKGEVTLIEQRQDTIVVKYSPYLNLSGTDSFTYFVNAKGTSSNVRRVEVTIEASNDRPSAQMGNLNTAEEAPITGQLTGTDADGDSLTFSIVSPPAKGQILHFDPDQGTYTYVPSADQTGTDTFSFKVSDGTLESEPKSITVNLANVNDAPTASDSIFSIRDRDPVEQRFLAADVDGDNYTAQIESQPTKGTVTIRPDGQSFSYIPGSRSYGTDTFTFSVGDGSARSASKTVSIDLLPQLDGTWATESARMWRTDDSVSAPHYECTAPPDWVITHTTERLAMPGFTISCVRGSETVTVLRPGVDLSITTRPDGLLWLSQNEIAEGLFSDFLTGYFSLWFRSGTTYEDRTFQGVNAGYKQGLGSFAGGIDFFEAFDGYRYVSSLVRKTP